MMGHRALNVSHRVLHCSGDEKTNRLCDDDDDDERVSYRLQTPKRGLHSYSSRLDAEEEEEEDEAINGELLGVNAV